MEREALQKPPLDMKGHVQVYGSRIVHNSTLTAARRRPPWCSRELAGAGTVCSRPELRFWFVILGSLDISFDPQNYGLEAGLRYFKRDEKIPPCFDDSHGSTH